MIAATLLLAAVQHGGHGAPVICTPEHAAMGHCRMPAQVAPKRKLRPAPSATPKPTASPKEKSATLPALAPPTECTPEHAAMGHCRLPSPAPQAPAGTDLPAGNAPPLLAPKVDYADRVFGDAMTASRRQLYREHGGGTFAQLMISLAEVQLRKGRDGYRWDGEGWFGGDRDRLVVKSEGRGDFARGTEDAEVQVLYSRAIGPYFDLQAGVRYDFKPNPSRRHLALGIEGLAPYWFEVESAVFLSERGDLSGRIEGYHDQRITQRLILQPRLELNLAAQDDRRRGIGSGISDLELGLRLRYELTREFMPYVGVSWDRKLGDSARFSRAAGNGRVRCEPGCRNQGLVLSDLRARAGNGIALQ